MDVHFEKNLSARQEVGKGEAVKALFNLNQLKTII